MLAILIAPDETVSLIEGIKLKRGYPTQGERVWIDHSGLRCQPYYVLLRTKISRDLNTQFAFLHGMLEMSSQTKPFRSPCKSNVDSDDISQSAQLGEYYDDIGIYPRLHGEGDLRYVPSRVCRFSKRSSRFCLFTHRQ